MDNIQEEKNQINQLNSSIMIRTNSKLSQNTNSGSNKNSTNQNNAKELMKSMLKKKSTMLFIQENQDHSRFQNSHIIKAKPQKDEVSPVAQPAPNFSRRTTLMPDFKSNLLNKSSQFKQKDETKKEAKKKNSSTNLNMKKFKSFREQPISIKIEPIEDSKGKNISNLEKIKDSINNFGGSSKSGRRENLSEINSEDEFKSADDSEARDIKRGGSKMESGKSIVPVQSITAKPQNFTDMAKRATIQEIQEDFEVDEETVIKPNIQLDDKGNDDKELSKITEDNKGSENNENIEFDSDKDVDDKENKKSLIIHSSKDENKLIEKSLENRQNKTDERSNNKTKGNSQNDASDNKNQRKPINLIERILEDDQDLKEFNKGFDGIMPAKFKLFDSNDESISSIHEFG